MRDKEIEFAATTCGIIEGTSNSDQLISDGKYFCILYNFIVTISG